MSVMQTVAALHKQFDWVHDVPTEMDAVIGDLSGISLKGQDVLCGVYLHPVQYYMQDQLRGGRFRNPENSEPVIMNCGGTGKETLEDVYQGKVLRILKLGSQAFNPDVFKGLVDRVETNEDGTPRLIHGEWGKYISDLPKVGDWVFCRCNDGVQISYKGEGSQKTTMFDNIEKMPADGGWPCRIVAFSDIIAKVDSPTRVV